MGVSYTVTLLRVLLPQAIPAMLPVIISQMVILLKDTSLGYIIGYSELLRSGRSIVEFYGNLYALQVYVAVAAMYIVVNVLVSALARGVAHAQRRRKRRTPQPLPTLQSSLL
jgi:glutamate transport system permease protein